MKKIFVFIKALKVKIKSVKNKNWQKVKYQKKQKQENLLDSNILILDTTAEHLSILNTKTILICFFEK